MIIDDGTKFFPYVLLTSSDPVLGLDPRPHAEVEAEWLAKVKRSAERAAKRDRASIKAGVQNERIIRREENADPILTPEGVGDPLDEVASPPPEVVEADEVLRLSGLPDGYGVASIFASEVLGVARAWGETADDFCEGVRTRFRKKKARRK